MQVVISVTVYRALINSSYFSLKREYGITARSSPHNTQKSVMQMQPVCNSINYSITLIRNATQITTNCIVTHCTCRHNRNGPIKNDISILKAWKTCNSMEIVAISLLPFDCIIMRKQFSATVVAVFLFFFNLMSDKT